MDIEKQLRNIASRIFNYRDGYPGVHSYSKEFDAFIRKPENAIKIIASERLSKIILHAYETSPYYRQTWKAMDICPSSCNNDNPLTGFPFVTKRIIEVEKQRMVSSEYDEQDLETSFTGGSSGTPASFFRDRKCTAMRMGRQRAILDMCGYSPGDKGALIWGVHEDIGQSQETRNLRQRLRKFAAGKESLHCAILDENIMQAYYERLLRFQPDVLYGYPNAMSVFAGYIKEKALRPIHVKSIICTAERLTEMQRQLLSDVFGGEVFNLYCTREHGCIGFECRRHRGFHLDIGSVFIEIMKDGKPVEPGLPGEIVVTDLLNYGMPLIRNMIGDRGSISPEPCDCGNPLPLLGTLNGRETEMLYRPDGQIVSGIMLIDIFTDERAIKEMQIIQDDIRAVRLNIVADQQYYTQDTPKRVTEEIRKIMGPEVNVNIHTVSEIPRNPRSGKYQEVICRIKDSHVPHIPHVP